jgi:hypothetical protein
LVRNSEKNLALVELETVRGRAIASYKIVIETYLNYVYSDVAYNVKVVKKFVLGLNTRVESIDKIICLWSNRSSRLTIVNIGERAGEPWFGQAKYRL